MRDYEVDGVPSSGPHKIKKSDLRNVIGRVELLIEAGGIGAAVWKASKALLAADLIRPADTVAVVYDDAVSANNGMYVKAGASGTGSWSQITNFLPGYQFVTATDNGSSAPNAYTMDTNPRLPAGDGVALVEFVVPGTNTSGTVTVSFDGAPALTVKTASGNSPAVGGLIEGMPVSGVKVGTNFFMRSDQASAALLAEAEAAADAAEAFRDQAASYADFARNNWAIAAHGLGLGSEQDIPLSVDPGSVNNMFVVVGGVSQLVTSGAYSLVYAAGDPFIRINVPAGVPYEVRVGNSVNIGTPADGTVTSPKIAAGAVTTAALGDGAVSTIKIADKATTFAKMQDIGTARVLGRNTSGAGPVQELTEAAFKAMFNISSGAGKVLDRGYAQYSAATALTANIPSDATIPQVTEGTEILAVTITPKSITSRFRCRAILRGSLASVEIWTGAIFSPASADALCADYVVTRASGLPENMMMEHEWVPGVLTPVKVSVRVGPNAGHTLTMGSTTLGGRIKSTLIVEEWEA